MRSLPMMAAGLVLALTGLAVAQSTTAPTTQPGTVIHVSFTGKSAKTAGKIAVGDSCTIAVKDTNDVYTVSVKDTTATPGVTANKGTAQESTLLPTLNLKKLGKVTWTVKDNSSDTITLTTSDTLPLK